MELTFEGVENEFQYRIGEVRAKRWLFDEYGITDAQVIHGEHDSFYVKGGGIAVKLYTRDHEKFRKPPHNEHTTANLGPLPAGLLKGTAKCLLVRTFESDIGCYVAEHCYFVFISLDELKTELIVQFKEKLPSLKYERFDPADYDFDDAQLLAELERDNEELDRLPLSATERNILARARVGQGSFKRKLLRTQSSCSLCGISNPKMLIGSHIKQWIACETGSERTDDANGLLMCPNHDALFDKGFITFDADGKIRISPLIDLNTRMLMNVDEHRRIRMSPEREKYMLWHREKHRAKFLLEIN